MNYLSLKLRTNGNVERWVKGKGIPITGHEGPRGMWMQGSTYSQPWHQGEVGWLGLRSAAFTPGKFPGTHFIGGWVDPGPVWTRRSEEKSPPLRHLGSNPGRPARSQAPCRLSLVERWDALLFTVRTSPFTLRSHKDSVAFFTTLPGHSDQKINMKCDLISRKLHGTRKIFLKIILHPCKINLLM